MNTVVGVDGCKLGWFYFRRIGDTITHGVATSLETLIETLPTQSRIFIDIPIGLLDSGHEGRECDKAARKMLGSKRASSVFPAPYRPVLSAKTYQDAKHRSLIASGKMLSQQAFAITSKIREIDDFLSANINARKIVREIHPELCFWGLNQRQAMTNPKKTEAGFEERIQVLEQLMPNVRSIITKPMKDYLRKEVSRDDILDALVGLIVGCTSDDALQTVPIKPVKDSFGLPMEMVYTEQPNERALNKPA
jgi:predicted RNase H-like nuclease